MNNKNGRTTIFYSTVYRNVAATLAGRFGGYNNNMFFINYLLGNNWKGQI